jgi:methionyl aminopeptidase
MNAIRIQTWDPRLRKNNVGARMVRLAVVTMVACSCLTYGTESSTDKICTAGNPPKPASATGLVPGALEGQNDDEADDDDKTGTGMKPEGDSSSKLIVHAAKDSIDESEDKKKKKRNKRSKKKEGGSSGQTIPPRVALTTIFHGKQYPQGEIIEYTSRDENLKRTTDEELRHLAAIDNMDDSFLADYRKAAEVHRQVRQHVQTIAKPGISMTELAQEIEDGVRALVGHQGLETGDALKAGMGFPTGLCLNNVGAHWTPNAGGREVVLQYDDVLKVDFGVHVNGRIVDSAFTVAANPVYDPLLEAVKAATNTGLKVCRTSFIDDSLAKMGNRKPASTHEWITSVVKSRR